MNFFKKNKDPTCCLRLWFMLYVKSLQSAEDRKFVLLFSLGDTWRWGASYRGWIAEPARTWVSKRWSRTLISERRRGPAGGQTWSSVDLRAVWVLLWLLSLSVVCLRRSLAFFFFFFFSSVGFWRAAWGVRLVSKSVFGFSEWARTLSLQGGSHLFFL